MMSKEWEGGVPPGLREQKLSSTVSIMLPAQSGG